MEKPILTKLSARGKTNLETLTKELDSTYAQKTFGEVVDYMLLNKEDDLNSEYDQSQIQTVETLRRWKNRLESNQGIVQLYFKTGEDLKLINSQDVVGDHEGALYTITKEFGMTSTEYKALDLVMQYNPIGGN